MRIPATYEDLSVRYPEKVKEIVAKILKSKSKSKPTPESLKWSFSWVQSVKAFTFAEVLSGKKAEAVKPEDLFVSIEAANTRSSWHSSLAEVPKEVWAVYEKAEADASAKKLRQESLTLEEKDAEVDELLKQLGKYPGFVRIGR